MTYGTTFEQGDIVILPFPFTDLSSVKQRPVVVLSTTTFNECHEDIITCGITSNLRNLTHAISISSKNMVEGSIPLDSLAKVDKIFTLHSNVVRKRLGKLNKNTIQNIRRKLMEII